MIAQLNQLLKRNKRKQKIKGKRTCLQKPTKYPGGSPQNRRGRLPLLRPRPRGSLFASTPRPRLAALSSERRRPPQRTLSPLSPTSPLSPRPRSSSKDREHRNPKNGAAAVYRRSTPPLTNRCWGKVRQDLFFVPAEPWFLGWRRFFALLVFLHRHRRGTDRTSPPISSPSRRLRPRRASRSVRGEGEHLLDLFPLSLSRAVASTRYRFPPP